MNDFPTINQSINQSIKHLSEQMQKHCSHCTSIWEKMWINYMPGNDSEKRCFKLSLCLNVDSITDDVTSDERLFRFLLQRHKMLGGRLLEDVSVVRQDPLMTQNANVVHLEDRRHAVDPSDIETRVLPA